MPLPIAAERLKRRTGNSSSVEMVLRSRLTSSARRRWTRYGIRPPPPAAVPWYESDPGYDELGGLYDDSEGYDIVWLTAYGSGCPSTYNRRDEYP